jgi:hypothetical protein
MIVPFTHLQAISLMSAVLDSVSILDGEAQAAMKTVVKEGKWRQPLRKWGVLGNSRALAKLLLHALPQEKHMQVTEPGGKHLQDTFGMQHTANRTNIREGPKCN